MTGHKTKRKTEGKCSNEVHAVARRSDQASVRDLVQGRQFREGDRAVQEVDRHPIDRAEPAVDPPDQLVDRRAQVLVLLDVLARRHGDLDEDDLAEPLWVFFEEDLHRVQLLRHALDVVEAVDADNDLDAFETTTERRDTLHDRVLRERLSTTSQAKSTLGRLRN